MDDKELSKKLERIVRESLDSSKGKEITPSTRLREELGMDSLDEYELIFALEEHLGIIIPENDKYLSTIETFQDIQDYLTKNYKL